MEILLTVLEIDICLHSATAHSPKSLHATVKSVVSEQVGSIFGAAQTRS